MILSIAAVLVVVAILVLSLRTVIRGYQHAPQNPPWYTEEEEKQMESQEKSYVLHFREVGAGTERKMYVTDFVRHDEYQAQPKWGEFRATTMIVLRSDGRCFGGISICSPQDNFDRRKGLRGAKRRASRFAFENYAMTHLDLNKIGKWDVDLNSKRVDLIVHPTEVEALKAFIDNLHTTVRNKCLAQVHVNRSILVAGYHDKFFNVRKVDDILRATQLVSIEEQQQKGEKDIVQTVD